MIIMTSKNHEDLLFCYFSTVSGYRVMILLYSPLFSRWRWFLFYIVELKHFNTLLNILEYFQSQIYL